MKIRPATTDDEDGILALLQSSLGWLADAEHARFYRWKHVENPFGRSAGWVAVDDGRIVGLRLFMRWEFRVGGRVVRAVRAVDTATHADYRGKGIFRDLTLHGLEALKREGVAFVFNTPNDQSRPGYLKMGWQVVGRLPVRVRPKALSVIGRTLRARVPAELSSVPTDVGVSAREVLTDPSVGAALEESRQSSDHPQVMTNRTAAYLAWRYGHEPLAYRVYAPTGAAADGVVIFRLRRRGPATEAVVADVLGPATSTRSRGAVLELWRAGADHLVALAGTPGLLPTLRVPGFGPLLTTRPLTSSAPTDVGQWGLSLGDVELM